MSVDYAVLDFIREHFSCGFLDAVMPVFTRLGNGGICFILVGMVLLFFKKYRRAGIIMLCSLALGAVVCNLWLKEFVARARPYEGLENIVLLISPPSDYSFPSGHTTAAFEFAFALALINRRCAVFGYVFAVLMAFSRLYLYVHFPSDVLAGAVIGTVASLIVYGAYRMISGKISKTPRKTDYQ